MIWGSQFPGMVALFFLGNVARYVVLNTANGLLTIVLPHSMIERDLTDRFRFLYLRKDKNPI